MTEQIHISTRILCNVNRKRENKYEIAKRREAAHWATCKLKKWREQRA